MGSTKIVIVGDGGTARAALRAALASRLGDVVYLVDRDRDRASRTISMLARDTLRDDGTILRSDGFGECRDAHVVVLAMGTTGEDGDPPEELARRNVATYADTVPLVAEQTPQAPIVVVSPPADVLTMTTLEIGGWRRSRVIGSGTVTDTMLLRVALAHHFGVDPGHAHAWVVGEQGDEATVAWSVTSIAGRRPEDVALATGREWSPRVRKSIVETARQAGRQGRESSGQGRLAVTLATARILSAILSPRGAVDTVSSRIEHATDPSRVSDVALSMPCRLDNGGCGRVVPLHLDGNELESLDRAAERVRTTFGQLASQA